MSFAAGTRFTAPMGTPSTRMIRLSPSLTCGRKRCTTQGSRKVTENRSNSEPKFGILHAHLEHRGAAVSVERLHDDLAVLGTEGLDLVLVARDQGRRHQVGELEDEDLLRRVANLRWIVDDQRLGMDALEDVGRRDVGRGRKAGPGAAAQRPSPTDRAAGLAELEMSRPSRPAPWTCCIVAP